MKIESSKTTPAEKRSQARDKPETTSQTLFKTREKLDSPPPARFAEVLEEARNRNAKNSSSEPKTERAGRSEENAEANKDEDASGTIQNREKIEEENERHSADGDEQSDEREKNSSFVALTNLQAAPKVVSDMTPPAARSILHVADLERIVSTIRSQNLKNAEQVVIALKHSILEGLQIKLTIDEYGTLKAEFLAFNEQIKNHLNARKQEMTRIFRERGVKLSDLNVRQGSEFPTPTDALESAFASDKFFESEKAERRAVTDDSDNQTSYRI